MLNAEDDAPLFDLLSGQTEPYEGFGDILLPSDKMLSDIDDMCDESAKRISEHFQIEILFTFEDARRLDDVIDEMWETEWNPETGDIDLFTNEFGLILLKMMSCQLGGDMIFRPDFELIHTSFFFKAKGVETFPFHKIRKKLLYEDGESINQYVRAVENFIKRTK